MSTTQADKDLEYSFSIVNYLSASYRGKLAGYTLLGQLEHPSFEQVELDMIQHAIDKIAEWLAGMLRGELLFSTSWTTLETFEAQNALSLLEKLRPDLEATSQLVRNFLNGTNILNSEGTKLLLSAMVRSSYARDIYMRGFVIYGESFKKPAIADNYRAALPNTSANNAMVQNGIAIFRDNQYNLETLGDAFQTTLMAGCDDLPSVFRTHIHDINLLVANFKPGGATFENLGFQKDEASQWLLVGINPQIAGYWRAYNFGPQESLLWLSSLVHDPAEATAWKASNVLPELAKQWKERGLVFEAALPWHQAGYTPEVAKDHFDRGIFQPPTEPE